MAREGSVDNPMPISSEDDTVMGSVRVLCSKIQVSKLMHLYRVYSMCVSFMFFACVLPCFVCRECANSTVNSQAAKKLECSLKR